MSFEIFVGELNEFVPVFSRKVNFLNNSVMSVIDLNKAYDEDDKNARYDDCGYHRELSIISISFSDKS